MKMTNRKCHLSTISAVIAVTFGLTLGGTPQEAQAGACARAGFGSQCVKRPDLKNNAINSAKVKNNSLTGADVKNNSLTGSDITSQSIPATDLSNEAGAAFAGGNQFLPLTNTDATVRFVTITAPSSGVVVVNASGYYFFVNPASPEGASCSITTGTAIDDNSRIDAFETGDAVVEMPFAGTRGFIVGPGSTTFNLVCQGSAGAGVVDSQITAIFVPTAY